VLENVTSVTGGHSVLVLQAYAYTKYLGKYHGYTWCGGGHKPYSDKATIVQKILIPLSVSFFGTGQALISLRFTLL
jgi:hypothetical protein